MSAAKLALDALKLFDPDLKFEDWENGQGEEIGRELRKAAESLKAEIAQPAAPAWMPIETAPKDESMILLGRAESAEDDGGLVSTVGRWQEGWEDGVDVMGCDSGFVDIDYQEFSPSRSFGAAACRSTGHQPTHWMPLPKAPGSPP